MPLAPIITFRPANARLTTAHRGLSRLSLSLSLDISTYILKMSLDEPELDLVMVPTDGSFVPYEHNAHSETHRKDEWPYFVLKFASSSQRYLFWIAVKTTKSRRGPQLV
ncbi:hypothetical protein J3459_007456 [Metarhizium acridum]|nr:hypothetical protein J3459_007456 [Metarhizium acridum]